MIPHDGANITNAVRFIHFSFGLLLNGDGYENLTLSKPLTTKDVSMLKVFFAALLTVSVVGASIASAEAAPRRKHYAKHKRYNKDSSSYGSYYRTQRSYYSCGYSRC